MTTATWMRRDGRRAAAGSSAGSAAFRDDAPGDAAAAGRRPLLRYRTTGRDAFETLGLFVLLLGAVSAAAPLMHFYAGGPVNRGGAGAFASLRRPTRRTPDHLPFRRLAFGVSTVLTNALLVVEAVLGPPARWRALRSQAAPPLQIMASGVRFGCQSQFLSR